MFFLGVYWNKISFGGHTNYDKKDVDKNFVNDGGGFRCTRNGGLQ
jgi:hypothetical protein